MKFETTLYDALEVSERASSAVVKAAYRSLAQVHHPDKNWGTPASCQRLVEINHAYSILSDPIKRMHYDQTLVLKVRPVERRGGDAAWVSRARGQLGGSLNVSRLFGFRPLK